MSVSGISDSGEFIASSHVIVLPEYADMRPMTAVRLLSATCFSSFSGLPARMLAMRSVCSCTYMSFGSPSYFQAFGPLIT